ncbi:response regulator transcription factor [Bacillus chungangensis]|uniref:DNA-binding response OmpR family regulator n=1 Tax=Bacillus chungangensis TaxID=587633 RepID=A0ABT9WQL5_9BACI|nr:response regulator transcription factor [Bacillus chungangensis]MDQ0175497.1 DNA-binding response OmpR family regulator [Bacillus chungangensis]
MDTILIVEDEENIRGFLHVNLKRSGFNVLQAANGEDGVEMAKKHQDIAVILLDIMLPGIDGYEVCSLIRAVNTKVGIIMLTAKTQETDKIQGLLDGADDYVTKPFSPNELIARIQSLLRRIKNEQSNEPAADDMILDIRRKLVQKNGEMIELTPTEAALLAYFIQAEGMPISRNDLLDEVWGFQFAGDPKIVDVNIRRLRQKIEDNPSDPRLIETIWGYGYCWKGKGSMNEY